MFHFFMFSCPAQILIEVHEGVDWDRLGFGGGWVQDDVLFDGVNHLNSTLCSTRTKSSPISPFSCNRLLLLHIYCKSLQTAITKSIADFLGIASFISYPSVAHGHLGVIEGSRIKIWVIFWQFMHERDPGDLRIENFGDIHTKLCVSSSRELLSIFNLKYI